MSTNKLDEFFEDSKTVGDFGEAYAGYVSACLQSIDFGKVQEFVNLLIVKREQRKTVYFIGNGGSAATASHFANDLAIGTRTPKKPFKVVSLTDNNAVMTAIGNDFGYDELFSAQLKILMEPGDVLVAISASGNSPNIIKGVEYAHSLNNKVVGLTGFSGGELKKLCDINIHVESNRGEYGPVEDVHMFIDHLVGSYLNRFVLKEHLDSTQEKAKSKSTNEASSLTQ